MTDLNEAPFQTTRRVSFLTFIVSMANHTEPRCFVTIGMFIVDEFEYCDEDGKPTRQHASSEAS